MNANNFHILDFIQSQKTKECLIGCTIDLYLIRGIERDCGEFHNRKTQALEKERVINNKIRKGTKISNIKVFLQSQKT